MEFDENNIVEDQYDAAVEIYSRKAIFWFAVLASPLFGGILLMLNLKAAGYRKAVYYVLAFVVLFEVVSYILLANFVIYFKIDLVAYQKKLMTYDGHSNIIDNNIMLLSLLTIVLKIIGALILTRYFFKKYFPDDDYYPKSIAGALLITVVVMLFLQVMGLGGI